MAETTKLFEITVPTNNGDTLIIHPKTDSQVVTYTNDTNKKLLGSSSTSVKKALDAIDNKFTPDADNRLLLGSTTDGIKWSDSAFAVGAGYILHFNADGTTYAGKITASELPEILDKHIDGFSWVSGTTAGPTATITVQDGGGKGISSTLNVGAIPSASSSASGVVTTDTQSFAGNKTFDNNVNITQNLVVSGNLTVSGSSSVIDTETLTVKDNLFVLNSEGTTLTADKLSGLSIITGPLADGNYPAYGFVFDPSDSTYKIGAGTVDSDKKNFTGTNLQNLPTIDAITSSSDIYYDSTSKSIKSKTVTVNGSGDFISSVTQSPSSTTFDTKYFVKINTDNSTAQTVASEDLFANASGTTINLHKISKTGSYSDLLNVPDMYWANISVANASDTETEPTFKNISVGDTVKGLLQFTGANTQTWSMPNSSGTVALQSNVSTAKEVEGVTVEVPYTAYTAENGIITGKYQLIQIGGATKSSELISGGIWFKEVAAA